MEVGLIRGRDKLLVDDPVSVFRITFTFAFLVLSANTPGNVFSLAL